MKKIVGLYLLIMLSVTTMVAQERLIKGTVIDAHSGELLIGASVYVDQNDLKEAGKMQKTGTITNVDGKFELTVLPSVKRLFVSYIGYEKMSFPLTKGKDKYVFKLKTSSVVLQDVVVTGYQTLDKRKLTASVVKVDVTDAMVGGAKSIDQALAGQVAGVSVTSTSGDPGAPAKIRIRGTSSLSGTQDPLWVLDGIPLEGTDVPRTNGEADIANIKQSSIAGISPNDIENITILKDAAATSIYGARAANGVIVITTKKGKVGKPRVNYSSKITYSPRRDIGRLNLMNSNEKIDLELELMKMPDRDVWGEKVPQFYQKGAVADILNAASLMDVYRTKGWDALPSDAREKIDALRSVNTDWNDILFRSSLTQEHNVSLSGGSERVRYYNSLGYTNQEGNVKGVELSRFNISSKVNYKLNKRLNVGASIFANRRTDQRFVADQYGLSNPLYYSRKANTYQQPFTENGDYVYDYNIAPGNVPNKELGFNIFEERENTSNKSVTTAINAIFDAELKFNSMWKVSSQIGLQWDKASVEKYVGFNTFNMRKIRENGKYEGGKKNFIPIGGKLYNSESTTKQVTWKTLGEFKNTFADIHDLQIMVGTEIRKNWYDATYSNAYGYDPKTLTTKPIMYPDENNARSFPLFGKTKIVNAFASFFANGSYTYDNRYTLGASVRMDGSDLFGVDKKYRYLPIYSLSGLWRIGNENFLIGQRWLDNLALRMSYGLQGNIDKGTSPFLIGQYRQVSILPEVSEQAIEVLSAPNSKLRWEKTASYNLGMDFSVLSNRLNLSVDYYYRKGTDLIGTMELPWETGFTSMSVNWASMKNEGVEINVTTRNIATKNFSWYTTLNFAYNKNKVLRMMTTANQQTPSLEGFPVGAIFALKSKVNKENGEILILPKGKDEYENVQSLFNMKDEYGVGIYSYDVTPEKLRDMYEYVGTSEAPYTGGLMNNFSYKNWELGLNMSYNFGAKVRVSPTYNVCNFNPGVNNNREVLNRWTPENTQSDMPALATDVNLPAEYQIFEQYNALYRDLDMWVKPLSYVRLQNINLTYHLPEKFLSKMKLSNATIGVEGRNLLVLSSSYKNYLDPESMGNIYSTPMPRSFSVNINLTF